MLAIVLTANSWKAFDCSKSPVLGVSQGGEDLAGSIRVVDEGRPSLERAEDGCAAEDVIDGFLRRVSLDAR